MADDFNWNDVKVVVPEQLETAVFENGDGAVVIRQRNPAPGEDMWVVIRPANLEALINELSEMDGKIRTARQELANESI